MRLSGRSTALFISSGSWDPDPSTLGHLAEQTSTLYITESLRIKLPSQSDSIYLYELISTVQAPSGAMAPRRPAVVDSTLYDELGVPADATGVNTATVWTAVTHSRSVACLARTAG